MPRSFFPRSIRFLLIFALFTCAAVSASAQGGPSTVSFLTTPDFPAGLGVSDLAVADFNGDGNLDVATTNGVSGDLTILFGRGQEGFAPPVKYLSGVNPYTVKAGDFNKDGKADLLTLNPVSKNISVLINDGTGNFSVSNSLTLPDTTQSMVLGDFNGDGNLDGVAAVNGSLANKLTFLKGDGAGSFTALITPLTYDRVFYGLAAGDFNEDGKLDIVAANATDGVAVLLGDGAGGFSAPTTIAAGNNSPYNVAVADFNGDNHLDLAVTNTSDRFVNENVMVLLGTGTGSFGAPKGFVAGKGPWGINIADFNGDNKQDMVVVGSGGVSVFLGDGTGNFSAAKSFGSGASPRQSAPGDFNGDGKLDIVIGNGQTVSDLSNGVALMLGDGTGDFAATRIKQVAGPGPMVTNDFNNDGKLDVAVLNTINFNADGYHVCVLLGDGAGNFTQSQRIRFSSNQAITSVATADFNSDGKADLAVTAGVAGIAILLGDGAGHFPTNGIEGMPVITSLSSYINGTAYVKAADFNNDGKQDLVVSARNTGGFVIMLGKGDGTFTFLSGIHYSNAGQVAVGDFNNDGKADFALVSDKIYILWGDGTGRFSSNLSLSVPDFVYDLTAADFNKDGKTDLAVVSNISQKNLTVFLASAGNNAGFDAAKQYDAPPVPRGITSADFNNDGNIDLATSNGSSYNVAVFAGDGDGDFLPGIPFDLGVDLGSIAAGDFNSDLKQDLIMVSGWTNSVHLILNNYTPGQSQPVLSIDDVSTVEGDVGSANEAVFTVKLSQASLNTVKVNYVFGYSPPAPGFPGSQTEFEGTNGTLTFAPGVTTQSIRATIKGDTRDEFDEKFTVRLSNPINAVIYKAVGTATITDDDAPPTVSIQNASSTEGDFCCFNLKQAVLTVSLSASSEKEIYVSYGSANGTAVANTDYHGSNGTLQFPEGTTSRTVSFTIEGDKMYEPDETFFVNLSNPINVTIGGQGQVTILNDDPLPTVIINDITVTTEGNSGANNVIFSATISNPSYQPVVVNYSTSDGTATAGADYTTSSGTITFSPGTTSEAKFFVPVIGDQLDEIDEVFYINVNVTNGLAPAAPAKATIIDDDGPALSINDVSVKEGDSGTAAANFTVSLSAPSPQDITVRFSTINGTATGGSDYQFAFNQLLTIPAGSTFATLGIKVNGDTLVESDETFTVALVHSARATIADSQGAGTIVNDDSSIQFSASAYSINENMVNTPQGYGTLTVEVNRTGDISRATTVKFLTSDESGGNECNQVTGQASQRCDYAAAAGTLRFAAGESTKQIQIPVIKDGYIEGNEIFKVKLQNPAEGVTLGAINEATVTIEDRGALTNPAENPYLSNEFFVRMNYLDFLAREPDAEGWDTWTGVLNNCGPEKGFLGSPLNCDRAHISHGFIASREFTDKGYRIYRMYEVGLLRLPRYAEFVPDMAAMSGAPDSQELEQNTSQFAESFTGRQEFTAKYADVSATGQALQLIARLEQNAGVSLPESATTLPGQPPQYGRQDLINKRLSGEFTLGQTLRAFVEQKVVYDRFFERGFVTMQYFGYLRRDPDLNDSNMEGWKEWVFVFTNGGAQRNRPDILPRDYHHLTFGFIYSEEYRKRFGQP